MSDNGLTDHELDDAQRAAGVTLRDRDLLREALTHPSYPNENPQSDPIDNQRLEFLGRSSSTSLAEWLYARYPRRRRAN